MDQSQSKAARTRQFIIESTAGIFNTKGYAGTSMADLTAATNLTKGSIYGNFENKEEVALAAFDYNLSKIKKAVAGGERLSDNYFDQLMVYAEIYHSFMGEPFPAGGCPILNTAVESDDTHPLLKEKSAQAIYEWRDKLTGLISAGIKSGEFKEGIQPEQLALSIIALIEGGMMIAKVTDKVSNLDQVLKTVALLITQLKA